MSIFEKILKKLSGAEPGEDKEGNLDIQRLKDELSVRVGRLEQTERISDYQAQTEAHEDIKRIEKQLLELGVSREDIELLAGRDVEVVA